MEPLTCQQISELLSAFLANELDAQCALSVAGHLEKCPACHSEFNQLDQISKLIKKAVTRADQQNDLLKTRATQINAQIHNQLLVAFSNTKIDSDAINNDKINNADNQLASDLSITSTINTSSTVTTNPTTTINASSRRWRRLMTIVAAAMLLLSVGFGLFTLYVGKWGGTLLTAVARNHRFCSVVEDTGVGWSKGDQIVQLEEKYHFVAPKIKGLMLDGGHPCLVYHTSFIHLIYLKDQTPISVYLGNTNAINRLRESEGTLLPDKIYQVESSNIEVAAFAPQKDALWIVAAEVSQTEILEITNRLREQKNTNIYVLPQFAYYLH